MAMTGAGMAEAIRVAMGFPLPVSSQLTGWGNGVVGHIQSDAEVSHSSGDVTGTCPPSGGPLTGGAADNGAISGMTPGDMATEVMTEAGYPSVSSELTAFCEEIVDHIETFGVVEFGSGDITGTCTNTPVSPGSLAAGEGSSGFIKDLDGDTLADSIHTAAGYPGVTSTPLKNFCNAIVDYIMDNAEVTYSSGDVTGTCPAGGGPLTAGAASNGAIS